MPPQEAQVIINDLLKVGNSVTYLEKLDKQLNGGGWFLGLEAKPIEVPTKTTVKNWFGINIQVTNLRIEWQIVAKYYNKQYEPVLYYVFNSTKEYAEMMAKANPIPF